jgi:uncharacterized protein (DUF1697 family)
MKRYAAFLRAINVGGRATVKMETLREIFTAAGCADVRTVIQSGNVIFAAPGGRPVALFGRIEGALSELLGSEAVVLFRSLEKIARLVESSPFKDSGAGADDKLYVSFLSRRPAIVPPLPLVSPKDGLEVFRVGEREAFMVSRRIKGRFGFPNNLVEKELGVVATTRNWNTVLRIGDLHP